MIPDTIQGLPTHILVVHAVVVLVPLGALGAVLYALVPRWRDSLRWTTLFVLTAGLASVPVAKSAGEQLRSSLTAKGQLGGSATWVLFVALVLLTRPRASAKVSRAVLIALSVGVLAGSATSVTYVVLTGHTGSKAAWNPGG